MLRINDRHGNLLIELPENLFPLKCEQDIVWGSKKYQIRHSYVWDETKKVKDHSKIKGLVMIGDTAG